jgi:hypothetical protein
MFVFHRRRSTESADPSIRQLLAEKTRGVALGFERLGPLRIISASQDQEGHEAAVPKGVVARVCSLT